MFFTLYNITTTGFLLAFAVSGVGVADGVSKIVVSWCRWFSVYSFGDWGSICYWSGNFGISRCGISRGSISYWSWSGILRGSVGESGGGIGYSGWGGVGFRYNWSSCSIGSYWRGYTGV